jgi:hypothetical protein
MTAASERPVSAPEPGQAALLAVVDGHFFTDGPNPMQLVCMTEDDNDVECDTQVAEVGPGTTWNELEYQMAEHARAHHLAAAIAVQQRRNAETVLAEPDALEAIAAAAAPAAPRDPGKLSEFELLAAACSHRDILAAALARIEALTEAGQPGGYMEQVHDIASGALARPGAAAPAGAQSEACPGCESLRRQCSELAGEVGALAGALTDIRDAERVATARETAHKALDRLHGLAPGPQPAPGEAERSWGFRSDEELAEVAKAARAYDYANRGKGNYASVPERQVARLILGALRAMKPQPAPELAADLSDAMRETASRELAEAMAESRRFRDALQQVAKHHEHDSAAVRVIAKIAKRALEGKS